MVSRKISHNPIGSDTNYSRGILVVTTFIVLHDSFEIRGNPYIGVSREASTFFDVHLFKTVIVIARVTHVESHIPIERTVAIVQEQEIVVYGDARSSMPPIECPLFARLQIVVSPFVPDSVNEVECIFDWNIDSEFAQIGHLVVSEEGRI